MYDYDHGEATRMSDTGRTFPREVVISVGYGAGLATWWYDAKINPYELVESSILINACRTQKSWDDVTEQLIKAGYDVRDVMDLYGAGWVDAVVKTVNGPYRIVERDGAERIEERDDVIWRD